MRGLGVEYIFGLGSNNSLDRIFDGVSDDVRIRWADGGAPLVRRYAETPDRGSFWRCGQRVTERIQTSANDLNARYMVTNARHSSADWVYEAVSGQTRTS